MKKPSVYLLEFDSVAGPKIVSSFGEDTFDGQERISLQSCAFPDTVIPNNQESTIFVFKIKERFCISMFKTQPDASAPRGHWQHTFVISSEFPYIYPFSRLLQSSLILGVIEPKSILAFIWDFLLKWFSNFPEKEGEIVELPMFDGSLPVSITENHSQLLSFYGGLGWTPMSKIYYINDNYLGFDLMNSFSLQSLIDHGRSFDVIRLWESCLLGDSILVYGATPTAASKCCMAIGSLLFPEKPPPSILPFISVTDNRFMDCNNHDINPNIIIGVSNPIALTKSPDFCHTFCVGFSDDKNGFGDAKVQWQFFKESHSEPHLDMKKFFYHNTLKVIDAITSSLNILREKNPYAEFIGHFNADVLEQQIILKQPLISLKPNIFAKKLLRSSFLSRIWKRRCTFSTLESAIERFNISLLCEHRVEHELIDIISTVMDVRHVCEGKVQLEAFIDRDIEIIKQFLAPDIVLAPIK